MKQLTLLTFVLTIYLTSFGQNNIENNTNEQKKHIVDTSVFVIIPFDTTKYWVFKDSKPTELTNVDLQKIETILNKFISEYNPNQENKFKEIKDKHPEYNLNKKNFTIDLTRYKRQYVAGLNSKGQKEVWINCFCDTWSLNWKKELIMVKDGGNCFFNLKINLTTDQYYDLIVNGEA
jgi:hypothetical protein